jgi:hypothetical protein
LLWLLHFLVDGQTERWHKSKVIVLRGADTLKRPVLEMGPAFWFSNSNQKFKTENQNQNRKSFFNRKSKSKYEIGAVGAHMCVYG